MKKQILSIAIILLMIVSCSKDDDQGLSLEVNLKAKKIGTTTAEFNFNTYSVRGGGNLRVLYKPVNSNEEYKVKEQSLGYGLNVVLSDLVKATKYEFLFETYNDKTSARTNLFYFVTKAVNFDYVKFYADNRGDYSNSLELFSHTDRTHVIHGAGFSDYNDVKLYLINEVKTDSILLPSIIVSDSLSFTIPNNYVSQSPRESFKKSRVGIKIKDSYQYIENLDSWTNESYNFENNYPIVPLIFKVFNTKPYIDTIELINSTDSSCPSAKIIKIKGEFLGYWQPYYWTPKRAQLILYESNGTIFNTFDYNYATGSVNNGCSLFSVNTSGNILVGGILQYHQRDQISCKTLLTNGTYQVKIIFTFKDDSTVETNLKTFIKS